VHVHEDPSGCYVLREISREMVLLYKERSYRKPVDTHHCGRDTTTAREVV